MQAGNCMLASMFRGKFNMETDEEGFAFIDRDGGQRGVAWRSVAARWPITRYWYTPMDGYR